MDKEQLSFRPFFDKITIDLPGTSASHLIISARGAGHKPYVKGVTLNGKQLHGPIIKHEQIARGGHLVFEMSEQPEAWGATIRPVEARRDEL